MTRLLLLMALLACAMPALTAQPKALLLEIDGVIGPASSDYVERGLQRAREEGAALVILRVDTPGGLDQSMRAIIQAMVASSVPVVVYVAPSGSRAASAGTYILYASHVAAMAPATTLGAATPVQIGTPISPGDAGRTRDDKSSGSEDAMGRKIVNDAVAYIRGLAQVRGRNAAWAEQAVREAATLTAEEALAQGVIELVAKDMADLMKQLDGRKVNVLGQERVLSTSGLILESVAPDWRTRLLGVISNPTVAYVLMLVGIYGLIYEFANPGLILPGVAGTICLLLALYAFQVLPINYAGLGLILLGIAFMVGEIFVPSFGALGLGGVIAFIIGSVILMNTDVPGFGIPLSLIFAVAAVSAAFLFMVAGALLKARQRRVVSGQEQLVDAMGEAAEDFSAAGLVRVEGELWQARTSAPLKRGQRVRVLRLDGLTLEVEPTAKQEETKP